MMTLGFLKKLYEEKLQVPKDYSIVSYDDSLQNYLLEIELTTVVQDITMIAEQACQMMFQKFTKEEIEKKEIILMPKLQVRTSVKNIIKK